MRFKKLTRLYNRLRFGNRLYVSEGSVWQAEKDALVRNCSARINGRSAVTIGAGAIVRNVSFQIASGSRVRIEDGACLEGMEICLLKGSELVFGKDGRFRDVFFSVEKGKVHIADNNRFGSGVSTTRPRIEIENGSLEIGDHNHVKGSFWVRFGGEVVIGRYNCINEQTEIRADESVHIGSYNMISYNCDIWDTNTHCPLPLDEKKALFEKDFPTIGRERQRPKTSPVSIGNGNWIGKYACILKGVTIKDNVTVGTRAIVSNMQVEDGSVIVSPKGSVVCQ